MMFQPRFRVLVGMVLAAAAMRLVPHPWSLTPIGALALFAGAHFHQKRYAFLVPLAAMLLSDIALGIMWGNMAWGLHRMIPLIYGCLAINVCLGKLVEKNRTFFPVAGAVLTGAVIFFLVTNFGSWTCFNTYPKTPAGLVACYTAGLPFFRNMLMSDAGYSAILFMSFAFAEKRFGLDHPQPLAQSS